MTRDDLLSLYTLKPKQPSKKDLKERRDRFERMREDEIINDNNGHLKCIDVEELRQS